MPCREDSRISAWVDGELPSNEARAVETHVESCAACTELVASLRAMSLSFDAAEVSADPGFVVRFRGYRDERSVAPWWTWRQLALRLVPIAAAVLVTAIVALWVSSPPQDSLQALEREALGSPVAFGNGPESVLSIAFDPFPQGID